MYIHCVSSPYQCCSNCTTYIVTHAMYLLVYLSQTTTRNWINIHGHVINLTFWGCRTIHIQMVRSTRQTHTLHMMKPWCNLYKQKTTDDIMILLLLVYYWPWNNTLCMRKRKVRRSMKTSCCKYQSEPAYVFGPNPTHCVYISYMYACKYTLTDMCVF